MRQDLKLSKHRYYELLHWCLQYPEWKKRLQAMSFTPEAKIDASENSKWIANRRTEDLAAIIAELSTNIDLVDRVCREASEELYPWLHLAVTKGVGFQELKMVKKIPCERDMFYDRRRRFFWLLDKEK